MRNRNSSVSDSEKSESASSEAQSNSKNSSKHSSSDSESDSSSSTASSKNEAKRASTSGSFRKSPEKRLSGSFKNAVALSPIEKFIELNPRYKTVEIADDDISDSDEISFIQVPKSVDPDKLVGIQINYDGKSKVKIDGTKYIIRPNHEAEPLLVMTNRLKTVKPLANFQVQKYVKQKIKPDIVESGKCKVSLPENLKVRHPLFGHEFKNKVVLDEAVEKKLNDAINSVLNSNEGEESDKKKKKKKKKREEAEANEANVANIFNFTSKSQTETDFANILQENDSTTTSKKKKNKKTDDDNIFATPQEKKAKKTNSKLKETEAQIDVIKNIKVKEKESVINNSNNRSFSESSLSDDRLSSHEGKKNKKKERSIKTEVETKLKPPIISNDQESTEVGTNIKTMSDERLSSHESKKNKKKEKSIKTEVETKLKPPASSNNQKPTEGETKLKPPPTISNDQISIEPIMPSTSNNIANSQKKKSKNKSIKLERRNSVAVSNDESEQTFLQHTSIEENKTKKKHKIKTEKLSDEEAQIARRRSIINSTAIADMDLQLPNFDLDVSRIYNNKDLHHEVDLGVDHVDRSMIIRNIKRELMSDMEEAGSEMASSKKKKKKKLKSITENMERKRKSSVRSDDVDLNATTPSKKLKKVKEEKLDHSAEEKSMIHDILNRVKTELDSSHHKKKKKMSESS